MNTLSELKIGRCHVGPGRPVFIVAELSANHRQDISLAIKTIRAMKKAGADAVKIQTYTPDTITLNCKNKYFRVNGTLWNGMNLYELYTRAYTPWEWQPKLKRIACEEGLEFFSSPFDKTSVDFLARLGVPAYKIASFEITDTPLIEYAASKGKPMIISAGLADKSEIRAAIQACQRAGNRQVMLLKCTSAYPAPLDEMNLKAIALMQRDFKCPVGLSDHTLGFASGVAAAALGACLIEKHFILDRKLGGPDAAFSLEPAEFKVMADAVRAACAALGNATYEVPKHAKKNRMFCRSLFATADLKKGQSFTEKNVRSIRPGHGMHPKFLPKVLGMRASRNITRGTPLQVNMVEGL